MVGFRGGIVVCAIVLGLPAITNATNNVRHGYASWYSTKESHQRMANGKALNDDAYTSALRSHDFGKRYRVTNLTTGQSVVVTHTDYGPSKRLKTRVIDLSLVAYRSIDNPQHGLCQVSIEEVY